MSPDFPVIGPAEQRSYLAEGRARLTGRRSRQTNYILSHNYMNNESQQWIPLSGPGSRFPTESDGDEHGNVWLQIPAMTVPDNSHWSYWKTSGAIAFMPIERRVVPPLPKPVEKTQEEKDRAKADALFEQPNIGFRAACVQAIRYGRSDGRKALAAECLGLFDRSKQLPLSEVADPLDQEGYHASEKSIRALHELLTEAVKS